MDSLQTTLDTVYNTMLARCGELTGIAQALAGLAALLVLGAKGWKAIAKAEPIEYENVGRPFLLGYAIMIFPAVIALINGVLQPTVTGTAALVTDSNAAIATLLQQKETALQQGADWQMYVGGGGGGDLQKWEELSGDADSGVFSGLSNRVKFEMAKVSYNFKNSVKVWLSQVLEICFEAAALCIQTIRTFYLVILAILGPLAVGLSIFSGFESTLTHWLSKYIHVYLWLPVANILGSLIGQIQQEMLKVDIAQIQANGSTSFSSTDTAYIIFLLLAIVAYFTVPGIAGYIVQAGGSNTHLQKITQMVKSQIVKS